MWIVQLAFAAALHLVMMSSHCHQGWARDLRTPPDISPNIKHSGRQHHLEL